MTILAHPFYVTGADGNLASRIDTHCVDSYLGQMVLAIALERRIHAKLLGHIDFDDCVRQRRAV